MVQKSTEKSESRPSEDRVQLDHGEETYRARSKWWQIWIPKTPPKPAPSSLTAAQTMPSVNASIFSRILFSWMSPLMSLGYQRTLQVTDLWQVHESQTSSLLCAQLEDAWQARVTKAQDWNDCLRQRTVRPPTIKRIIWRLHAPFRRVSYDSLEDNWYAAAGMRAPSLVMALNDVFGRLFWSGAAYKVAGDMTQLLTPLLLKAIIKFARERSTLTDNGAIPPSLGRGVGMAIGMFLLAIVTSLAQNMFWWHSCTTGVLVRAAVIGCIYKRGVGLSGKSRVNFPNSMLINHISADASRVEVAAQWFHCSWTAPIQVLVCLVILLTQLGPSALAGFSLFLFIAPLQQRVMAHRLSVRQESMKFTDRRAKLLLELLGSIRVVKFFSYEIPFLNRIYSLRKNELKGIRSMHIPQSANTAFAYSIPVIAASLSFVVYTTTTKSFDIAIVFASFSLFQLLRQPMMFLPRALSATADARNGLDRLTQTFQAELKVDVPFRVDPSQSTALQVSNVTFEWEQPSTLEKTGKKPFSTSDSHSEADLKHPFQVSGLNMTVQRGQLVAIVGSVGSGKSSILSGLVGEMRKLSGDFSFGDSVAYCPQMAWIQNATVQENILFGQPYDDVKFWKVVQQACLSPDLATLPAGVMTEIGEKGVNISGGQKQRINLARALYFDAPILLLDDPLSAVDAHVGSALFHEAILPLVRSGKTIILVTHALHFLAHFNYIYAIRDGKIVEHGTYDGLISRGGEIAKLDIEFGRGKPLEDDETPESTKQESDISTEPSDRVGQGTGKLEGRLIVKETRKVGSVSWKVYVSYLKAARGAFTLPLTLLAIILMQGSQIANSYTLVWWQANTFHQSFSWYQALYAGLGLSQALFTFLLGLVLDFAAILVSNNLHRDSIRNVFYAPMSFFDTTPVGRIMGVFGKDIDNVDNMLPMAMRLATLTISNVLGSVVIITVLEHYFAIVALFIFFGYRYYFAYYQASALELKRLDSLLRSLLYSHFSESLSGLPTIRSFGEIPRFITDNLNYIDLENRALLLIATNQRWLTVRLDALGALLVFCVAIFAVTDVAGISPAQVGLVLTYTTQLTQLCGMVTRQTADVEQNMNSVERLVQYSRPDEIEQEPAHELPDHKPPLNWPQKGSVGFQDVTMNYRAGLHPVLKGITFQSGGGEKIGIVGRTGAGKSSLTLALLRMMEFSGSIIIDDVDITTIGLKDLRSNISILPQDPTLFSGTVRSNLDPFDTHSDPELWGALRRSLLVEPTSPSPDSSVTELDSRITLDTVIEPEGANLSVGQRSLLSLARALVKNSRIVVLDEATASVDLETDRKIQDTIQSEFKSCTLLCIAHRLRTILSYDRILVLDGGVVSQFDSPLRLFDDAQGIFRGLCTESNISRLDILKAQSD